MNSILMSYFRCSSLLFYCLVLFVTASASAPLAQLTIEITRGKDEPAPIAVVPFAVEGEIGEVIDMAQIITSDLNRTGRFTFLNRKNMLSLPKFGSNIIFREWRQLRMDFLIVGLMLPAGENRIELRFSLYNVLREREVLSAKVRGSADQLRLLAHRASDQLHEALTGIPGPFATRIAYTAFRKVDGKDSYVLLVADSDGANEQPVYTSDESILSPDWAPDGKHLAYVTFEHSWPVAYQHNLQTGERWPIMGKPEYSSAPAWSPDGERIALVLSRHRNIDIYMVERTKNRLVRLTRHFGIDTEPRWLPNGSELVFTSDRGGTPQIYKISIRGGAPVRMSFEGEYNARPVPLPDGEAMLVVNGNRNRYNIALQPFGGNLRLLTGTELDESPTVAPNGDMLMYATNHNGRGILIVVSIDSGSAVRLKPHEGEIASPAWSDYIDSDD